jgi:hypothetical protein
MVWSADTIRQIAVPKYRQQKCTDHADVPEHAQDSSYIKTVQVMSMSV